MFFIRFTKCTALLLTVIVPNGHVDLKFIFNDEPVLTFITSSSHKNMFFLFSLSQLTTLYITLSMILSDFEVC